MPFLSSYVLHAISVNEIACTRRFPNNTYIEKKNKQHSTDQNYEVPMIHHKQLTDAHRKHPQNRLALRHGRHPHAAFCLEYSAPGLRQHYFPPQREHMRNINPTPPNTWGLLLSRDKTKAEDLGCRRTLSDGPGNCKT
ncbi:hypothetical protein NQ315_004492 [Exocentrus adspersus]|uniref:Uncharacterized protein n=1 Tax=Exocentrus adspersus TaxID=1586481 RepID=A0AAV8VPT6_9CUCU|nr:hypothetical protein NQ315_004492 [Exocentrus adspersus]